MKRCLPVALLWLLILPAKTPAQEITLEEITVETTSPLERPLGKIVDTLTARLQLEGETRRALELRALHQNSLTTLLELSAYSPVSLGASDRRVDTFFRENAMRPDLNPREEASLFPRRR